jgi:hypothetical protein
MAEIPRAKMSPRIENGIIYWYEGDTFELNLAIDLRDQDGCIVEPTDETAFEIIIRNERKEDVYSEKHYAAAGVTFACDEEVTKLFKKGKYRYDVNYYGEYKTSIAEDNIMIVE